MRQLIELVSFGEVLSAGANGYKGTVLVPFGKHVQSLPPTRLGLFPSGQTVFSLTAGVKIYLYAKKLASNKMTVKTIMINNLFFFIVSTISQNLLVV